MPTVVSLLRDKASRLPGPYSCVLEGTHGADGLTSSCIQPAPEDLSGFPPTECEAWL